MTKKAEPKPEILRAKIDPETLVDAHLYFKVEVPWLRNNADHEPIRQFTDEVVKQLTEAANGWPHHFTQSSCLGANLEFSVRTKMVQGVDLYKYAVMAANYLSQRSSWILLFTIEKVVIETGERNPSRVIEINHTSRPPAH